MRFLAKRLLPATLLYMSFLSASALADSSDPAVPLADVSLAEPSFACSKGACIGLWASLDMPLLQANQIIPISTDSPDFNFYLGNDLSGTYSISLSPYFLVTSPRISDELRANLATADTVLGTSTYGNLTFSASSGTQYYLLLSGLVKAGETYSLSVMAVPEPEQYLLLGIGLGMVIQRISKNKKRL